MLVLKHMNEYNTSILYRWRFTRWKQVNSSPFSGVISSVSGTFLFKNALGGPFHHRNLDPGHCFCPEMGHSTPRMQVSNTHNHQTHWSFSIASPAFCGIMSAPKYLEETHRHTQIRDMFCEDMGIDLAFFSSSLVAWPKAGRKTSQIVPPLQLGFALDLHFCLDTFATWSCSCAKNGQDAGIL